MRHMFPLFYRLKAACGPFSGARPSAPFCGGRKAWLSPAGQVVEAAHQTLRFFGGRQPLCGIGVTSEMLVIFKPQLLSARTADSRPGPGPPTRTSTFFTPCSCAATPAFSAATCAANGVLLREPRKPQPPEVAQDNVFPWRSVIVMIVLLKEACTCAIASSTFLRAFFGFLTTAAPEAGAPPCCCCF